MTEPKAMREIHEIREKIYEETKNMTASEHTAYFNAIAEKALKEFGIKIIDKPESRYPISWYYVVVYPLD